MRIGNRTQASNDTISRARYYLTLSEMVRD